MEGCDGNLPAGTQIRSMRMSGALDGALEEPVVSHPLLGHRGVVKLVAALAQTYVLSRKLMSPPRLVPYD
jgi:hypothetical protein